MADDSLAVTALLLADLPPMCPSVFARSLHHRFPVGQEKTNP